MAWGGPGFERWYSDACPSDVVELDRVLLRVRLAGRLLRRHPQAATVMLYALSALCALLVVYLFYAVVHPERF
jgi:K+-transporting ATPase KdpF subunit